mmetsp:Transcript_26785/g.72257  ORF Transcript_26785/g.72257 Transcript_26785/m.72257 type:complete len:340 (-) Transcript_26785:321-1340(-)
MKVAVFCSKPYDEESFRARNADDAHDFTFFSFRLTEDVVAAAKGFEAVVLFVNDKCDAPIVRRLHEYGVRFILLRCAGFNNVDLETATKVGIKVARVPAYSPNAIAEHAVMLMFALDRKIHHAHVRSRQGIHELSGLMGNEIHGRTLGVMGTGRIGFLFAQALRGFDMRVLCYDVYKNPAMIAMGAEYVSKEELYREADVISLHCPLMPATHHIINAEAISMMKKGVKLINTSRGGLIDTEALIEGLKTGKVGGAGMDVYENEANIFFKDHSHEHQIDDLDFVDDQFARLQSFPNVLITGHQAWFTKPAVTTIANVTRENLDVFAGPDPGSCKNMCLLE